MKRIVTFALVVTGFVNLSDLSAQSAPPTLLIPKTSRQAAPALSTQDVRSRAVATTKQRGKVLLLDFWATWCTGCKIEIPWYIEFDKKYRAQGLASMGVALDEEGWSVVTPYLREHPISYPVVVANPTQNPTYNLNALPVTMLIDRQGRVAATQVGVVDKADWEAKVVALLGER